MKILMVGPHKDKVKGGMSTVISSLTSSKYLKNINILNLNTVIPGSKIKKGIYFILNLLKFNYICITKEIDIIHIHTASGNSFTRKTFFINVAKLYNKKIILHIHGGGFEEYYDNSNDKVKITNNLNKCDCILVLTESWKKKISKMTSSVVLDLFNSIEANTTNVYDSSNKEITFVGRIEKEKGIFELLEVAEEILNKDNEFKFNICGDGELAKVEKVIKQKGIYENFKLYGWVGNEEICRILKKTGIFVLPSYVEAMPMSIIEAMNYGIPVVSTKVGSIPEIIEDGINGFLVEPKNIDDLRENLLKIIDNDDLKNSISDKNFEEVSLKYCNSLNHKKLEKFYNIVYKKEI